MTGRIAFIGTGIMGAPMAANLAESGFEVVAWNRTAAKAAALESRGVRMADSVVEAVRHAEVVVCMLSSGPVCDDILLGPQGVFAAIRESGLVIVMSSIPVGTARAQAEAARRLGLRYVDAPVSGGESGAREATLAIMAGGEADDYAAALPVFGALGRPTHVGPAGSGQLAKLVNQLMVASTIVAVSEGLLLAERGGADPAKVREALLGGFANSTVLRIHGRRMVERDFLPGGPAKYQFKDTSTARAFASSVQLDLPMLRIADDMFADLVAHGDGDLDHSAAILELHRRNSLAAPAGPSS